MKAKFLILIFILLGYFSGARNIKDPIVNINVDYWGGKANYKWKIFSLTNTELKVLVKEQKYDNTASK